MMLSVGRISVLAIIFNFLFVSALLAEAAVRQYRVDTAASVVKWTGTKVAGSHNGLVKLKSGTVAFADDGKLIRGSFVIDMNSIVNQDIEASDMRKKLEGHLKSEDFFAVASFPDAVFELKQAVLLDGKSQYNIFGILTVKGISNSIEFPATIEKSETFYKAKAEFSIDRSKWQIKYNSSSFFDIKKLGDKLIYDDIDIKLDLRTAAAE